MIYLNNSATSFPKPECVTEAVRCSMLNLPFDEGRGNNFDPENPNFDLAERLREALAEYFGINDQRRIAFTSGATESLNTAIHGLDLRNCEVVISPVEHNSVLRPLRHLEREGKISIKVAERNIGGEITPESLARVITPKTRLVVASHVSNVTGEILDLRGIAEVAHYACALLLADLSQSAGNIPVNIEELGADLAAFTAHKALYGIAGLGGLYVRDGIELVPQKTGGTGILSQLQFQPEKMPLRLEAGTQNQCGMAALLAGLNFVKKMSVNKIAEQKKLLWQRMYEAVKNIENIRIFVPARPEINSFTNLSFRLKGDTSPSPDEIAYRLATAYDIHVRAGLHCSPLATQSLNIPPTGTVRVSPGIFNTPDETDYFAECIKSIARSEN